MRLCGICHLRMTPGRRAFVALLGALFLGACASLPPPAGGALLTQRDVAQSFSLEARFSLRHAEKSYAGRLSWRHAGSRDEVLLSSPFGQGMAEIVRDASGVRLTASDGKKYAAADVETLTQEVLGFPLPLEKLVDWVRGRSARGEFDAPDAFGRPLRVRQDGWRIDYEYDGDDAQALPARLLIEHEDVLELRLRVDEWNVLRDEGGGR